MKNFLKFPNLLLKKINKKNKKNYFFAHKKKHRMPRALVTHAELLSELGGLLMREHTTDTEKRTLYPTIVVLMKRRQVHVRSSGADRMDRIIHLATTLKGYELSYFQRCCMDAILPIVAPIVFKGCPAHELGTYMAKKRWKSSFKRMIFLEISRRSGKSDLLSLLAAIFLLVLPSLEVLAWSLYNETSALFGRTMAKWFQDLGVPEIHSKSSLGFSASDGHIFVYTGAGDDVRVIYLMGSQNPNVGKEGGANPPTLCISIFIFRAPHPTTIYSLPPPWRLEKKHNISFCGVRLRKENKWWFG